jgi:hypothetical protein
MYMSWTKMKYPIVLETRLPIEILSTLILIKLSSLSTRALRDLRVTRHMSLGLSSLI